jgi:hypothetical protein
MIEATEPIIANRSRGFSQKGPWDFGERAASERVESHEAALTATDVWPKTSRLCRRCAGAAQQRKSGPP